MKKSDLKSKMIVKTRVGVCHLVVDDILVGHGYYTLLDYKDDLTHEEFKDEDIIEVLGYYNPRLELNNGLGHNTELIVDISKNELTSNYKTLWFKQEYTNEDA